MASQKIIVVLGILLICFSVGAKQVKTKKTRVQAQTKDTAAVLKTNDSKMTNSLGLTGIAADKIVFCISRAGQNLAQNQEKEYWLSPVLETYYYFKFSLIDQLYSVSRKKFSKSLHLSDPYGAIVPEVNLINAAKKAQSDYILMHTYGFDTKTNDMIYSLKILSTNKNKAAISCKKTFPVSELNKNLDECFQTIVDNLKIKVDKNTAGLLTRPALSQNQQSVKDFGLAVVAAEADTDFKTGTDRLIALVNNDPVFPLAVYKTAYFFGELHNFEQAGNYLSRLFIRQGFETPSFFAEASRNYRLCQQYNNADRMIALAENKSINSPLLTFEKELVKARGLYTPETETLFKQMQKANPDNPDVLLFSSRQNRLSGAYNKALSIVNSLIDETIVWSAAYAEKAIILIHLGKCDNALQCLDSAQALAPQDSTLPVLCGDAYFAKQDFIAAAKSYTQAFAKMNRNMDLLLKISESYRLAGNPQSALDIINKNKRTVSDTNQAIVKQTGLVFYTMQDTAKARQILEEYANKAIPDTVVLLILGDIYAGQGNREKAIEMYTRAAPLVKDKMKIEFSMGKIYLAGKDLNNAEKRFLSIYKTRPDYQHVNRHLGFIYRQKSQYKPALAHLLNERKYSGDDEKIQQNIAELYMALNDLVNAEKEAKKLVELNSKNGTGYALLAEIALKRKQVGEAERNIALAEQIGAVEPVFYKNIAGIFLTAGLIEKAIAAYQKYLARMENDAQAWIELAQLYKQIKQDAAAAQAYLKIYACNAQKNLEYLAKAGHTFYQLDLKDQAYEAYTKYIEKAGMTNNEVNYNAARIELDKKNFPQVIKLLRNMKADANTQPKIAYLLALTYYNSEKFKEAIPYFKQYLTGNPRDSGAVEMLALAYEKSGFIAGAVETYQRYLSFKKTDKHREYAFHTAELLENSKESRAAINQYAQNVKLYPDDIRNYERLSSLYVAIKNYDLAIATFEKMMKLPSVPFESEKKLAELYGKKGNKELALATYERYIQNRPNDPEALFQMGMIYYEQKMYDKACNPLARAYDLMPEKRECLIALAASYIHTNAPENAIRILQPALEKNARDPEALKLLTECYSAERDTVNLITTLERRLVLEPGNFEINFQLGELFKGQGNDEKAIQAFERARRAKPSDESSKRMLLELLKKKK